MDASAAHAGGASADATWERLAQAVEIPETAPTDSSSTSNDGSAHDHPHRGHHLRPLITHPSDVGDFESPHPSVDLGQVPTSPINRVDSTVPLAAELSAELSISSAASASITNNVTSDVTHDANPVEASSTGDSPAVITGDAAAGDASALRYRAGCAPPQPAALPAAVEARNRAARVAAAACGLRYAGIGVKEAAALAETVFSSAAAVEAISEVAIYEGGQGARGGPGGGETAGVVGVGVGVAGGEGGVGAGESGSPSAPQLVKQPPPKGASPCVVTSDVAASPVTPRLMKLPEKLSGEGQVEDGEAGQRAPAGPGGVGGIEGVGGGEGEGEPLLGPASPNSAAGAAMMTERWASDGQGQGEVAMG